MTLVVIAALACTVNVVHAKVLDEEQARNAVTAFFSLSPSGKRMPAKKQQQPLRLRGHEMGCYIFDKPEGGTVFVADDDAIGRTILGYTEQGCFDADSLPTGLRDWLDQVSVLMTAVHEGKLNREFAQPTRTGQIVVNALIKTTWNQYEPYNNLCPTRNGKRCITGCVATAMAQVMKYWEWPKHGYGSVTYYDEAGCGMTLSQDFSRNYYRWDKMLNDYSLAKGYTTEQADAVATLMRDCGYAVNMCYTPSESSGGVSANIMRKYFHYSIATKDRYSGEYPKDMWHEFIQQDLREGRPVLYNGQSAKGGHEFIIDGYDTNGYYHVNWGWGGYQDGWFMLTNLNGYNDDQMMINNLMPDYNENPVFSYTLEDSVLTISGSGVMPQEYTMETAPWKNQSDAIRKIVFSEGITGITDKFGYSSDDGNYHFFRNLKEVVLPEGLLYIGSDAFYDCEISSVKLPSTLTCMNYAFFGCQNIQSLCLPKDLDIYRDYLPYLKELTVDEDNAYFCAVNNVLYSKDRKHLLFVPTALNTIIIAETTEDILDYSILYHGTPIISMCNKAPELPKVFYTNPNNYILDSGFLFIPAGSTGYDRWETILPPGWMVMNYTDLDRVPDFNIRWQLDGDGTLTISGWGPQKNDEFESRNAPYYQKRNQVKKLVVEEGVSSLAWAAYWGYDNMTEAELPSTLSVINSYCFGYTKLSKIICMATKAPTVYEDAFTGLPESGKLFVPLEADYSSWLKVLPTGWQIEYVTPESFAKAYVYTGEEIQVKNLGEWKKLLSQYPNAVGIINPKWAEWTYLTYNMLSEDDSAEGGYSCPYFLLTDLTSGYGSSQLAHQTGFVTPVSFTAVKGEYARELSSGFNTVCLPFAVSANNLPGGSQMYVYSYFDKDKGDVIFDPQSQTEAGSTCFVISKEKADWQTDLSGVTVTSQSPSDKDGNTRGTFISVDNYKSQGYAPRAKDNIFAPLEQYLHPFRACIFIDAQNAPGEVRIRLSDNNDATGIIDLREASFKVSTDIYTLDGKRLLAPRKGQPYIKNGKIMTRQ